MSDYRETLKHIRSFPSLIKFLRDDLDWPISTDDFEELTFDYTPEELGIDTANAAKIQEIKRLRPLSVSQPWGIFFIKFEPKRLPVVALRRILSKVALKKRASANDAERTAWATDDLLFISNYGEGESRQISFAHFSQDEAKKDLPALKVLGWDNLDTPLHLDHVAELLTDHLTWPDDEEDEEEWRKQWRSAFILRHLQVITTSKMLSVELAKLARSIRDRINTVLSIETENGSVTKLMAAFKEALVHDLDEDGFADMYAQTIAYGLLSARIANPSENTANDLAATMPVTSPFLKELMETFLHVGGRKGKTGSNTGIDFDELGVSEVVELLDDANMEAVIREFGDRKPHEDPVIHFYEDFLAAYDKKQKVNRGVFYTPFPVVSYIVHSVDELLRTEFGLKYGIADTTTWGEITERISELEIPDGTEPGAPFVQILDPATGTGTFLVEVIDQINQTMTEKWKNEGQDSKKIGALWNEYVVKHLLPRLYGFELMMAPYAIAHMKIGLKLYETGYNFVNDERAQVYLTNALEPAQDFSETLAFAIPALAHEARTVSEIKLSKQFTVVIGNPPYSISSQNRSAWIQCLLQTYKKGLSEKKVNLDDDYIKFICAMENTLVSSGVGILGCITANSYLDGVTHRLMRRSILDSFQRFNIVNLHGNIRRKEKAPNGGKDENVFEIMQGVAIAFGRRLPGLERSVGCRDIWGTRADKQNELLSGNDVYEPLVPQPEHYLLIPNDATHVEIYESYPSLLELFFETGSGIQTKRDTVAIQRFQPDLKNVLEDICKLSGEKFGEKYSIPTMSASWSVESARNDVENNPGRIIQIAVRPFDIRWTYYTGRTNGFHARPRKSTPHLFINNLAIVAKRQTKEAEFSSAWVVNKPINEGFFSIDPRGRETIFPLWLDQKQDGDNSATLELGKVCNLQINNLPMKYRDQNPNEIFCYIYGVLNSTIYRSRFIQELKMAFPRIPFPNSHRVFKSVAELGENLCALHTGPFVGPSRFTIEDSTEQPLVQNAEYKLNAIWLNKNSRIECVPTMVWEYKIGGYQICEKWLKDRRNTELSISEVKNFQEILSVIEDTLELVAELDRALPKIENWDQEFAQQRLEAES
jgi:predicted helicase